MERDEFQKSTYIMLIAEHRITQGAGQSDSYGFCRKYHAQKHSMLVRTPIKIA